MWVENKDTRKPKSIRNFTDVKTKHLVFLIQLSLSFLQEVENFTATVKSTQLHMLTFGPGMEAIWHLTQRNQFESVDVQCKTIEQNFVSLDTGHYWGPSIHDFLVELGLGLHFCRLYDNF